MKAPVVPPPPSLVNPKPLTGAAKQMHERALARQRAARRQTPHGPDTPEERLVDELDSPNGALSPLHNLSPKRGERFKKVFSARAMRQIIAVECDPAYVLMPIGEKARLAGLDPLYYRWLLLQAPFLIEQRKRVNELIRLGEGGPKLVLYKKALDGQPWALAYFAKMSGWFSTQSETGQSTRMLQSLTDWLNGRGGELSAPTEDGAPPTATDAEDLDVHVPVRQPTEEEASHASEDEAPPDEREPGEDAPGGDL